MNPGALPREAPVRFADEDFARAGAPLFPPAFEPPRTPRFEAFAAGEVLFVLRRGALGALAALFAAAPERRPLGADERLARER